MQHTLSQTTRNSEAVTTMSKPAQFALDVLKSAQQGSDFDCNGRCFCLFVIIIDCVCSARVQLRRRRRGRCALQALDLRARHDRFVFEFLTMCYVLFEIYASLAKKIRNEETPAADGTDDDE
jgi:hypothetical protein